MPCDRTDSQPLDEFASAAVAAAGEHPEQNKVVIAVARELCGFVWAIARETTLPAQSH
jgi:hypothetical protein